jgi:transposase-like protein
LGRTCEYTAEKADAICARLAQGESLRSVCRDEQMPDCATVFAWMRKFPEFLKQYARAKEESADAMAEEMLEIADDGRNDWMERHGGTDDEGNPKANTYVLNGEHVQRSRVRIDTRKWLASKLKPKKYGDRVDLTNSDGSLTGADALAKARARVSEWRDPARTSLNGNGEAREH